MPSEHPEEAAFYGIGGQQIGPKEYERLGTTTN